MPSNMPSNELETTKPLIVLDLDLTIIGDVKLLLALNRIYCKFYDHDEWFFTEDDFIELLKDGLLRPGFKEFIEKLYKRSIIIIYTLSNRVWAEFVVKCIKKHIGIDFVSVLLTEEDTVDGFKSIPVALKQLSENNINIDASKILVVDDNPKYKDDHKFVINKIKAYPYLAFKFVSKLLDNEAFKYMRSASTEFDDVINSHIKYFLCLNEDYKIDPREIDIYIKLVNSTNEIVVGSDSIFTTVSDKLVVV